MTNRKPATTRRAGVLMLVDILNRFGGAERLVAAIAIHLPQDRFQVTVCATRSIGAGVAKQLTDAGVHHFALGRRHRLDLLPVRHLLRFMRVNNVDVLHAHKFPSNLLAALTRPLSRVPVVIAHDHGWSHEKRWRKLADGHLIGRAVDAFVAGTRADAKHLVCEGVAADKAVVVPGAYIPGHSELSGNLRSELELGAGTPVVGTVGVLRAEKAYEVLIEAFALLSAEIPEACLVIAGDGPCRSELEQLAARLRVTPRTHFLGFREDVGAVLRTLDVASITSDRESTSLFALECMAHEVPLVSTRVGGPAEFLEDEVSALLISPRDPGALATALVRLLRESDLRRGLADVARRQLEGFTIERIAERHAALYDRLLDQVTA